MIVLYFFLMGIYLSYLIYNLILIYYKDNYGKCNTFIREYEKYNTINWG